VARTIPLDRYRNIGILARLDAGRTTVTERILAVTDRPDPAAEGARAALGKPAWVEQDNERQITLTSAATSCVWQDCRITIVELSAAGRQGGDRALGVLDGVVLVIDGVAGVADGVAALFDDTEAQGLARLVFVNKLDREGADLSAVVAAIAARGSVKPVLLQLPIGAGAGLRGIVDLVEMQATLWRDAGHDAPAEEVEIPSDLLAAAQLARAEIVAAVGAEGSDVAVLRQALKIAVRSGSIVPVLCGSAFRNRGIRRLLDAVVDYLPAPSDLAAHAGVAADGNRVERRPADGKGEIRAEQAALQHRHDRPRRSWQDVADRGDHQGAGQDRRRDLHRVRPDRQGAGRARPRHHDLDRARGIRDQEPPLRARRLPRPRRLCEEHDHRRGADGRRDPGGVRRRRPDAADPRAHPARPPGRRAGAGGVPEQDGHGRRSRAGRAGRAGSARAAESYQFPGDDIPIIKGSALCALEDKQPEIGERRSWS
jgi:small GTP-binding protein